MYNLVGSHLHLGSVRLVGNIFSMIFVIFVRLLQNGYYYMWQFFRVWK